MEKVKITETEESKPDEWNEIGGEIGPSLELPVAPNTAQLEQREIYEAPLKGNRCCYCLTFSSPTVISFLFHLTLSFPSALLIWIILTGA